ncbi:MAG: HEAT repeat domain-containing protein [Hydrogenophilus sp.]|nr:HEAT repeat domain-containing protein [Hydrogenophilus sp.]
MALKKTTSPTPEPLSAPPADLAQLLLTLNDPDPQQRRDAIRHLITISDPRASAALGQRVAIERDKSVIDALIWALAARADDAAVDALFTLLRNEEAYLRNQAIEALKTLPDPVAQRIHRYLADPDPDVRIFAINILESLPHPDIEQWLSSVVANDPHLNVVATALDLLTEIGTPRSRPAIEAAKARFPAEPYLQFTADLALKRIAENGR